MTEPCIDAESRTKYPLGSHIRKTHAWLAVAIGVGVYLWLVGQTILTYWHNTHTNPFPQGHVLPTQKVSGCQEKLGTAYASGSSAEQFRKRTYWKQMFLLDSSAIAYNGAGILTDPACLGYRIQGLMEVPFPVNYYVLRTPDEPPVLFLHKD